MTGTRLVLGYRDLEDKETDYAHLKQALSEQFSVVRNRSELETRFYSSSQKHNQKPSDLLKIHKILKLEMTEEKLIDHIISRLEPQILDYVRLASTKTHLTFYKLWIRIDRKIGGKREVKTDNLTKSRSQRNSIDLRVKVLRIIRNSMVDAGVGNLIIDSIIKAVDRGGSRNGAFMGQNDQTDI
ncbi:uncharacterized protein TNCV_1583101 [Trichonephila clavipes]|nr:uncharacterized protein TNCV_1583101 [Trichonephila clavipes]